MNLNHQDIQAILQILDSTSYDELQLESNDFSLDLKRGDNGAWSQNLTTTSVAQEVAVNEITLGEFPANKLKSSNKQTSNQAPQSLNKTKEPTPTEEGLIDVRSPMVGTFYRSPQPGADSFVDIGEAVEENTIIAIIEVMKLMSSIPAKINGEIREILVKDAQLVEKGQLIMRVKPVTS